MYTCLGQFMILQSKIKQLGSKRICLTTKIFLNCTQHTQNPCNNIFFQIITRLVLVVSLAPNTQKLFFFSAYNGQHLNPLTTVILQALEFKSIRIFAIVLFVTEIQYFYFRFSNSVRLFLQCIQPRPPELKIAGITLISNTVIEIYMIQFSIFLTVYSYLTGY